MYSIIYMHTGQGKIPCYLTHDQSYRRLNVSMFPYVDVLWNVFYRANPQLNDAGVV